MHWHKVRLPSLSGLHSTIGLTFFYSLAHAEIYMALAAIVRTFGERMELYETGLRDVEIHHDVFIPLPFAGTKGIRVLIKS